MAQQSLLIFKDRVAAAHECLGQMSDLLLDTKRITAAGRDAITESCSLMAKADRLLAKQWP
jgi:hypothetical protein